MHRYFSGCPSSPNFPNKGFTMLTVKGGGYAIVDVGWWGGWGNTTVDVHNLQTCDFSNRLFTGCQNSLVLPFLGFHSKVFSLT